MCYISLSIYLSISLSIYIYRYIHIYIYIERERYTQKFARCLFAVALLCVSSLRRGRANLLCLAPSLADDPRRESNFAVALLRPSGY